MNWNYPVESIEEKMKRLVINHTNCNNKMYKKGGKHWNTKNICHWNTLSVCRKKICFWNVLYNIYHKCKVQKSSNYSSCIKIYLYLLWLFKQIFVICLFIEVNSPWSTGTSKSFRIRNYSCHLWYGYNAWIIISLFPKTYVYN